MIIEIVIERFKIIFYSYASYHHFICLLETKKYIIERHPVSIDDPYRYEAIKTHKIYKSFTEKELKIKLMATSNEKKIKNWTKNDEDDDDMVKSENLMS